MIYNILNQLGERTGQSIVADEEFMLQNYPEGNYELVPEPAPVPEPPKPYATLIDIGPFYDRFGAAKMAVLTSQDPGIRAILADLNIRKWIDLARPDVAQAVQHVGSVVTQVTPEIQATILNTVTAPEENLALRKLYFS